MKLKIPNNWWNGLGFIVEGLALLANLLRRRTQRKPEEQAMQALNNLKTILQQKAANPLITMLLGFVDQIILLAYGQQPEVGQYYWRVVSRLILNLLPVLRAAAAKTPSTLDDAFLEEVAQACNAVEPGYSPVPYPA